MAGETNKKTLRHFYCRDVMWQTFEKMSEELDKGIDDLVNEAMRLLAREHGYLEKEPEVRSPVGAVPVPPPPPPGVPRRVPPPPPLPLPRTGAGIPSRPTSTYIAAMIPPPLPNPAAATLRPGSAEVPPVRPDAGAGAGAGMGAGAGAGAGAGMRPGDAAGSSAPLYLVFQNQRHLVDKDQFIIGRGDLSSDLAIKDGNISRKHAVVIRKNGAYYIKDLGSTNGIDHQGQRIDNKRIEEGDVFSICDYQFRFTFR